MGRRAVEYLTTARGISRDRLVFINGGYREANSFELWVVPQGAEPRARRRRSPRNRPCPRAARAATKAPFDRTEQKRRLPRLRETALRF